MELNISFAKDITLQNKLSLPERVIVFRKRKNINQTEFANLIGVSKPTLSYYENGKYPIPNNVQKRIRKVFRENNFTITCRFQLKDCEKIRLYRKCLGYSQKEFAKKIGYSIEYYSLVESERIPLSHKLLERIEQGFSL
ncbi:hypothetical protein CN931_24110 [Bacillus sp. AFS054943]|uniref:HTH cro/C1-type domain-containing protein n=1 Tax=Bacillus cereus TaxID=1396 RepID=A0A2C1LDT9_BACCE|nr:MULTISPECIES: helix-turn-helix transcriptional regulator [Bacillus]MBE7123678.1 helix-turn-helix transcriptional regulator [Bacillus cereus]PGL78096.1 hypothetical protein CN931_24110 [Bacillus sp. AFS054943]PGT96646.1 hypothetical protein COD19_27180 [Bacillus cereus]TKI36053.1 helix-turn-helix transcriptional regulator [Bacillus mycoides]